MNANSGTKPFAVPAGALAALLLLASCASGEDAGAQREEARPCCYVEQNGVWLIYRNRAYCNFPRAVPCDVWPKGS